MALPFLPGNVFSQNVGKNKYHKSHHFDFCNKYPYQVGEAKPGIGGEARADQRAGPRHSDFPRGEGSKLPAWLAFDRQVLAFDAYYQEPVNERREEQYRIHECKIYFYLEDDSIQVVSVRIKNSGIPQGTIIRRHRIPKYPPRDDEFFTVQDFEIGAEVNLYSKVFKIIGCDEFTRNFLTKMGVRLNSAEFLPEDAFTNYRKMIDDSQQPLRPYQSFDTLKQFLAHDRHVLRFYCMWDDTDSMFGDPREMILHYFLADDTIEIKEVNMQNSGRDTIPMFVRRSKLPKNEEHLYLPGQVANQTILNVFGSLYKGGRYILDNLKTGHVNINCYKDSDLSIGAVINVWGRKILLCDCDEYTKEFYRTKYGITDFTPIPFKKNCYEKVEKTDPPYNGFGTEEDSLCSCRKLVLKPPKKDFVKFMTKDRCGFDSNILRFLARLNSSHEIERTRRFIISYHLSDDSMTIYETPIRDSGIASGKFLERRRIKKPDQPKFNVNLSECYTAQDLYIGAIVNLNEFKFVITDADEYVFKYMEKYPEEFPKSDINEVLKKLKSAVGANDEEIKNFLLRNDPEATKRIKFEQLHTLMQRLVPDITEHEILTAAHFYGEKNDVILDMSKVISIIQENLRKKNFEDFENFLISLKMEDREKEGYLKPDIVQTLFKSHHIPIHEDTLKVLLERAPADDQHRVNYEAIVQQINWRENPVPILLGKSDEDEETQPKFTIDRINYACLLQDLFGNQTDNEATNNQ